MRPLSRESTIGFIGAGAVGGSLAASLSQHGYRVVATASRTFASAQSLSARIAGCTSYRTAQELAGVADVVFITTPDDAIEAVASGIQWRSGQGVVHCSGVTSLEIFERAVRQGAVAGAFHPLQQFSSVDTGVKSIPGITFGIEGEPQIRPLLEEMAVAIGGNPIFLRPEDKPLYHVTGVMMGNLLSTFGAVAAQLWEHFGLTRAQGVKALAPMMRQVSVNLDSLGIPEAISGPYVRGDVGTVRKHLEALQAGAPEVLPLYRELALAALPFAVKKGALEPAKADEIRRLLEESGRTRP